LANGLIYRSGPSNCALKTPPNNLTTNASLAKAVYNDYTVTSAILDRLLHHCQTVTITGSSYRMGKKIQD
jgi:DNA replication protein DnaC